MSVLIRDVCSIHGVELGEGEYCHVCENPTNQLVIDACHIVNALRSGLSPNVFEATAAASLARVTIMLGLYGSKPDSILHVIHEHGHTEVTLADVEAVREFVLSK